MLSTFPTWALLLARIFEVFPLRCKTCKQEMEIISFINERETITRILSHLKLPTQPPLFMSARGPPSEYDHGVSDEWDGVDEDPG